jgi:ABC-type bacteriocin/lantibiotic exporter with double-glycine peptidase domain
VVARAAALWLLISAAGAGCYTGSARGVASLPDPVRAPGWVVVRGVPFVHQQSDADCGAAAMAMALSYWGQPATLETVVAARPPHDGGIAAGDLRDLARARGLQAFLVPGTFVDLDTQLRRGRPVVVGLAKPITGNRALQHYEVVIGLNRTERRVLTWDPAQGLRENSFEGFAREWIPAHQLALILFPRPAESQQTPSTQALPGTDETATVVTAP